MTKFDRIKPLVQFESSAFKNFFNDALKTNIPLLNIITRYILGFKSNQELTSIVFLAAKSNGGINQSTYVAASLIKLLHTASLVHDDVRDTTRGNRVLNSMKYLWQSKLAVLMGDYLLSRGLLLAIKYNEFKMLEIISLALKKISEGEMFFQEVLSAGDITVEKYLEFITKKSAAIMAASFTCGSMSSGRSENEVEKMNRAGYHFGISYQIKEDILLYQKRNAIKKTQGTSLKSFFNLPYIYAINQVGKKIDGQHERFAANSKLSRKEQEKIVKLVSDNNGLAFAREYMHHYKNLALQDLDDLPTNVNGQKLKKWISATIHV